MSGNKGTDIWIAGAFAAFTVDLLVYPLDTLKTRIQSPDYRRLYTNGASGTIKKAALFRGLYQGIGSVILATLPSSGAFFTTYEFTKRTLTTFLLPANASPQTTTLLLPILHSASSATAELLSCAILTPAEVIKQNAQMVSASSIASTRLSATAQTLKKFRRNPLALWRGYGALAGRNLPFTALQFPLFERIREGIKASRRRKRQASGGDPDGEVGILEQGVVTAVSAGSGGAVAAVLTTPVDVVKTRIMLAAATSFADQSGGDKGKSVLDAAKKGRMVDAVGGVVDAVGGREGGDRPVYKKMSSLQIAKDIVQEQGWRGLWRGGALRGVWTMVGSGLYLGVYESGKVWLGRRDGNDDD